MTDDFVENSGFARVPSGTTAKTPYDHLVLPDGRKIGQIEDGDLCRTLQGLAVPGVSPENGRATNVNAFAAHVERIRAEGATAAMNNWLSAARAS